MGEHSTDKFSQALSRWLSSSQTKTLGSLIYKFEEKSFAILFLLLMIIPALPLPTGGVTHVFEIIVMLLSLELIAGRSTVWLPKRWLAKTLPQGLQTSALPKLIKMIRFVENHSRPRLSQIQINKFSVRLIGFVILLFTLSAFLAPPFSGLDTLPSIGVVFLSLALIFEDTLISLIGLVIGGLGVGLVLLLGRLVFKLL